MKRETRKRLQRATRAVWGKDCDGCAGELKVECRDVVDALDSDARQAAELRRLREALKRIAKGWHNEGCLEEGDNDLCGACMATAALRPAKKGKRHG